MRQFRLALTALAGLFVATAIASAETRLVSEDPNSYLDTTPYIDTRHPEIARAVAALTAGKTTDQTKALAIFQFVRDDIKFGWTGDFYDMKASDVLAAKRGYCNTKSTLFVALLRAAGIPARQVFVDINQSILDGFIDTDTPYVDHSFTEVWLANKWVKVDAYIVDAELAAAARVKLTNEDRTIGYGIHLEGTQEWDAANDAFAQFYRSGGDAGFSTRHYGVYQDVGKFYAAHPEAWNRMGFLVRAAFPLLIGPANSRVDRLRASGG